MEFLFRSAADYALGQALFLRLLGLVYLLAFASLLPQVKGLYGRRGLSPLAELLRRLGELSPPLRYRLYPSLFWLDCRDGTLIGAAALGILASALLAAGIAPTLMLLLLYLLYLSFTSLGQKFLGYQWDALLLETGAVALLLSLVRPPTPLMMAGCWFFFFRFLFSAGVVKLSSGDPSWRELKALEVHYETQPLPNRLAWWSHQLPRPVQKFSCLGTFVFELAVPLLALGTAPLRLACFALCAFFQGLILSTGSYGFFNLLSLCLALPLLHDRYLQWLPPWLSLPPAGSEVAGLIVSALFVCVLLLNLAQLIHLFVPAVGSGPLMQVLAPWRLSNPYGLFAVMTTQRLELEIEGSRDGKDWKAYPFRWKPGDPTRAPAQAAPHQPRLDWQMWFAALDPTHLDPWLVTLLRRLLEGEETVLALLAGNPFPEEPPRQLRICVYRYRFTDLATRRKTGRWWERERLAEVPVTELVARALR